LSFYPKKTYVNFEGALLTHCTWNSVSEGIVSSVRMVCRLLYSEQRINKVHVVEEMKVVVLVVEGYENVEKVVNAKEVEVEAKARMVMVSEEGKKLRDRLVMAKAMAVDALKGGGSSDMAFDEFIKDLKKKSNAELMIRV
jgi:hypothetical protein